MMTSKITLVALATIAAMLAACQQHDVLPTTPAPAVLVGNIMPLKVGNRWIGRVTGYNSAGHVVDRRDDTIEIVDRETYLGLEWYRDNRGDLHRNTANEYWWIPAGSDDPLLRATFPAAVGDTFGRAVYMVVDTDTSGRMEARPVPLYRRLASLTQELNTPYGKLRGYVYEAWLQDTALIRIEEAAYTPGLGPTLVTTVNPGLGAPITDERWELVEVRLN